MILQGKKYAASEEEPLGWEAALEKILSFISTGTDEEIAALQGLGRYCSAAVYSRVDVPPFDNSAMDGYAIRAADTAGASENNPAVLRVTGQASAGSPFAGSVEPGTAVEIMTGAPIPNGADAVIRIERTRLGKNSETVEILESVSRDACIRRAGADTMRGDAIVEPGTQITAGMIGLLASCGEERVRAIRLPRIALLTGGDEIQTNLNSPLLSGQIYDSNSPMLRALIKSLGAEVEWLGNIPDDPAQLREMFSRAGEFDAMVSVGGVSMGKRDYIRPALEKAGAVEHFWRINQQPGGPMLFATLGHCAIFGLPGNPVSSYFCADLYLRSAIGKMRGEKPDPLQIDIVVAEDLRKSHAKESFIRATIEARQGILVAKPTGNQDSNRIRSIAGHHGYIIFPAGKRVLATGERASFLVSATESVAAAMSNMKT
jgi:molybdopterin molybdotransferase